MDEQVQRELTELFSETPLRGLLAIGAAIQRELRRGKLPQKPNQQVLHQTRQLLEEALAARIRKTPRRAPHETPTGQALAMTGLLNGDRAQELQDAFPELLPLVLGTKPFGAGKFAKSWCANLAKRAPSIHDSSESDADVDFIGSAASLQHDLPNLYSGDKSGKFSQVAFARLLLLAAGDAVDRRIGGTGFESHEVLYVTTAMLVANQRLDVIQQLKNQVREGVERDCSVRLLTFKEGLEIGGLEPSRARAAAHAIRSLGLISRFLSSNIGDLAARDPIDLAQHLGKAGLDHLTERHQTARESNARESHPFESLVEFETSGLVDLAERALRVAAQLESGINPSRSASQRPAVTR